MLLVFLSFQGTLARLAVIGRCSTYVYLVWRLPNKKMEIQSLDPPVASLQPLSLVLYGGHTLI